MPLQSEGVVLDCTGGGVSGGVLEWDRDGQGGRVEEEWKTGGSERGRGRGKEMNRK